jgi:hypothetical protein
MVTSVEAITFKRTALLSAVLHTGSFRLFYTQEAFCCFTHRKLSAVLHTVSFLLFYTQEAFCCFTHRKLSAVLHTVSFLLFHTQEAFCCFTHRKLSDVSHTVSTIMQFPSKDLRPPRAVAAPDLCAGGAITFVPWPLYLTRGGGLLVPTCFGKDKNTFPCREPNSGSSK